MTHAYYDISVPDEHLGPVDLARLDPVDLQGINFGCVVGTCHNSSVKRICYLIGFSNITHNKVPAVFEDHIGAHERSQVHLGQESILAIAGRNSPTCGDRPVSHAAPGVSALPIIQNPVERSCTDIPSNITCEVSCQVAGDLLLSALRPP